MQIAIVGLAWITLVTVQAPNSLGEDPWKFDQVLDSAYLRRDTPFFEHVVTEDMRFIDDVRLGAPVLGKQEFLKAVRFSEALDRSVDSVRVEFKGDTVQTRGHIQVRTLRSDGPEYQTYYVRVYRRGPEGWQLASHETLRQVDGPGAPTPLVPPVGRARDGYVLNRPSLSDPWINAYRPGNGVSLPRVLKETQPHYTAEAMRAGVQGTAMLECVVNTDGTVSAVRVARSVDSSYGLDDEAIKAASQWLFTPATRNGQAVPVIITIELSFILKK